jgi:dipeptidase E
VTFSPKKDASLMMPHTVTETIARDAADVSWGEPISDHRRIVAAGSGREGLAEPQIRDAIIHLSHKATPSVLYLGTATYDLAGPEAEQTGRFAEVGCAVTALKLASCTPSDEEMQERFEHTDVIIASGGNTLFAVDRWRRLGVDHLVRQALQRGAVLSGGSAGAISWFDGGHSDSMDPQTYKPYMLAQIDEGADVSRVMPLSDAERTGWDYIRVPGLGFLPGLCCPHHDRTQTNGVLRAVDFDRMLLRHTGETGIGIDHFAALVVDGEDYRVISIEDREGSVDAGRFSPDRRGKPGIWRKTVVDGKVQAAVVPATGKVRDLLRQADAIVEDVRLTAARAANPDDQP